MFGVSSGGQPLMIREVECLCWTERKETVTERRGDQVRHTDKYHYKCEWKSDYVSSRSFRDQKYNVNVKPNVHGETIRGGLVRVGNYYKVDLNYLQNAFGLTKLRSLSNGS